MTQTHSRSRQQAEIAFAQAQSQFFARDRTVEEPGSIVQTREEKAVQRRKARLAKELEDRARGTAALISKRGIMA